MALTEGPAPIQCIVCCQNQDLQTVEAFSVSCNVKAGCAPCLSPLHLPLEATLVSPYAQKKV